MTTTPELSTLLQENQLATVLDILRDPNIDLSTWFDSEYSVTGENCLHMLVRADPPVELLQLMLQRLGSYGISEPELSVDDLGRTPLHLAAGCSCGPAVIQVLISSPAGKMSTRAQDSEGRLPLHVAMRPYILYTGKDHKVWHRPSGVEPWKTRKVMKATVSVLLEACPQAVLVEDDKKRTPMDYADTLTFDRDYAKCGFQILEALRIAAEYTLSTSMNGLVIEVSSESSENSEDDISLLSAI